MPGALHKGSGENCVLRAENLEGSPLSPDIRDEVAGFDVCPVEFGCSSGTVPFSLYIYSSVLE